MDKQKEIEMEKVKTLGYKVIIYTGIALFTLLGVAV